jgi:L-alanine-DL-glutamate epimerase-like enolase superfamily enzyme
MRSKKGTNMKVTKIETLSCDGGWRTQNFVKISTDEGITGYSEANCLQSAPMLVAAIKHLGHYIVGTDPMNTEAALYKLYSVTHRQIGGLAQQAISALDAALLDIKGKALGVPVHQLFGGPVWDKIRVYYTHAGRPEPMNPDTPPVRSIADIPAAAAEIKRQGFTAIKMGQSSVSKDGEPKWWQDSKAGDISNQMLDYYVEWFGAWRDALGPEMGLALDVAFSYKMGGMIKLAQALEPLNMMWLEAETLDAESLRTVRLNSRTPICIGESLRRCHEYKPFLESHALEIIMPDTVWNGITEGKKVADYANTYDIMFAPHNSHGVLGTLQAVNLVATLPNFLILEYEADDRPWRQEIVSETYTVKDGFLELPTKPGLGVDINEEAIAAHPPKIWRD